MFPAASQFHAFFIFISTPLVALPGGKLPSFLNPHCVKDLYASSQGSHCGELTPSCSGSAEITSDFFSYSWLCSLKTFCLDLPDSSGTSTTTSFAPFGCILFPSSSAPSNHVIGQFLCPGNITWLRFVTDSFTQTFR